MIVLSVCLSFCEQDYWKNNEPISLKLGIMTKPTYQKNWLSFGGAPVPDTDSGSILHFSHNCKIGDFRRFISNSHTVTAKFFYETWRNDWQGNESATFWGTSGSRSGLIQQSGSKSRITFGWNSVSAEVCTLWAVLFNNVLNQYLSVDCNCLPFTTDLSLPNGFNFRSIYVDYNITIVNWCLVQNQQRWPKTMSCSTCAINKQLKTWIFTNKADTSTKHKQSIQSSDLDVLTSLLSADIQQRTVAYNTQQMTHTTKHHHHHHHSWVASLGVLVPLVASSLHSGQFWTTPTASVWDDRETRRRLGLFSSM